MISVPTSEEVDQYGWPPDDHEGRSGRATEVPRIADGEAVCRVFQVESGSGAYWARGDVDVHILHAKQFRSAGGVSLDLDPAGAMGDQAWLAKALRERREQRWRLLRAGVQTSASGLVMLNPRNRLVLPSGAR
jgi:hypothetical protein